jgi:hypothetical protein
MLYVNRLPIWSVGNNEGPAVSSMYLKEKMFYPQLVSVRDVVEILLDYIHKAHFCLFAARDPGRFETHKIVVYQCFTISDRFKLNGIDIQSGC